MIIRGDALSVLKTLDSESVNCCMTSPPYWALRDYGVQGQLGLEPTFNEYITRLCDIFDEVKRVLRTDGTLWVNIGDTYYGNPAGNTSGKSATGRMKLGYADQETRIAGTQNRAKGLIIEKSLCNIPARFSIEMQNRGWILRNIIIWHKPNCMPSSIKDRFTVDFEYLYFFVKSKRYYFDQQYEPYSKSTINDSRFNPGSKEHRSYNWKADKVDETNLSIKVQRGGFKQGSAEGRNKRCVWTVKLKPFKEAHFATYPESLCETPIKAGCPVGGVVLDPFFGAGTTGLVALKQNKKFIGIELNPEYVKIAEARIAGVKS